MERPVIHGCDHGFGAPDMLRFGEFNIKVSGDKATDAVLITGDGQFIFKIGKFLDGTRLIHVELYVTTVSTSGKPTVQLRNVTQGVDMLSTKVEIDANEFSSETAATQFVINNTNSLVARGDRIAIDVDVAGTGVKGLGAILNFG